MYLSHSVRTCYSDSRPNITPQHAETTCIFHRLFLRNCVSSAWNPTDTTHGYLWEMTLMNLPPTWTLATTQWIRTSFYPPELQMGYTPNSETGEFPQSRRWATHPTLRQVSSHPTLRLVSSPRAADGLQSQL